MGVIEDVENIKKELEEVKEESERENLKVQELKKVEKANKLLLKALVVSIFAFIFLLIYTFIVIKYWQIMLMQI